MPGDPSIWEMAEACVNIIPSRRKLAAVAAAVQPVWAAPQGGRLQQGNAQTSRKQGKKMQKVKFPMFLCGQLTGHVELVVLDPLGRLSEGRRVSYASYTWYVARALSGVRKRFPDAHLYHYMDDILVAASTQDELLRIQPRLLNALHAHGLQVYRIDPSIDVTVFITTPDSHPTDTRQLQLLHFCLLLGISLAALLGNGLIISAVTCGHHLHTPMFFFLLNLALSDLGSICTTVPKAMHNSLWDTRDISYSGCVTQVFFFAFFMSAEFSLLTIMCYDRYVSICKPLHYGTLLGSRACAHMAAAPWASGFLYSLLHKANTFSLPPCHGNVLGQFFCEVPQILKLSRSHSNFRKIRISLLGVCLGFGCFVFIVFSYVQIFRAVLRIPSEQGRHKAFSTCLPHLVVVSLFISTAFFAYLNPPSISSPSLDLALSVLYSVVPPALNPLIYNLRNQELKNGLRKIIKNSFQKQ
ncbi:olfactory receptor 14A16-like [Passerculus sandwichensis]